VGEDDETWRFWSGIPRCVVVTNAFGSDGSLRKLPIETVPIPDDGSQTEYVLRDSADSVIHLIQKVSERKNDLEQGLTNITIRWSPISTNPSTS